MSRAFTGDPVDYRAKASRLRAERILQGRCPDCGGHARRNGTFTYWHLRGCVRMWERKS